jgi:SAM-dependent methyltransferase
MGSHVDSHPSGSAAAFEAIATQYDTLFSPQTNPLVVMMRERVYQAVARHFPFGATLLEIGCGTGEDTLALVARGYRVISVDPAPGMIAEATEKVARAGRADAVRFVNADVDELAGRWRSLGVAVDGVFSNFAPLNCALSLAPVRSLLEDALPRGGRFVGVVLPRICPLEVALSLARGDVKTAIRRWRREPVADVEGRRFPIAYYGAGDFDRALGAGFRRVETRSLGLWLPPVSWGPAFARVPGLLTALGALEDLTGGWPGLRRTGDHILLAFERS